MITILKIIDNIFSLFKAHTIFFAYIGHFIFSSILFFFLRRLQDTAFIESLLIVFFIITNLLGAETISLSGYEVGLAEPLSVISSFLFLLLIQTNSQRAYALLHNTMYMHFILTVSFCFFLVKENTISIHLTYALKEYLYNGFVSLLSIQIAYRIELFCYNYLKSINYKNRIAIIASQLFDTIFYTVSIQYEKPLLSIFSIFLFSFCIKLLSIFFYSIILSTSTPQDKKLNYFQ